ncbi:MAG: hypothetical protein Fues2KO_11620 [Fuerstiella sp.]
MFHRNLFAAALLAVTASLFSSATVTAQDADNPDEAEREAAFQKLGETLKGIDNLFYKEVTTDSGYKFYQVMWESEGESSRITIELRELGHYQGKKVFKILAYATVAQSEGSMPPAVIKAVATRNERTGLGHFSMPEEFNVVYINCVVPSDTLTPGQLWMIMAYIHDNRIGFKEEIGKLMSASGR